MATRAHSTRTPLLPPAGATPPLLPRGLGRQPGPVTQVIRNMRAAEPQEAADRAIEAIREGLDRHFVEADRQRVRELRRRISERIEADIALLDELDGDTDLEADHVTTERAPDGSLFLKARTSDDEPSLCGVGSQELWGNRAGYPVEGGAWAESPEDREHDDADGPEGDDEREPDVDDEPSLCGLTADARAVMGLNGWCDLENGVDDMPERGGRRDPHVADVARRARQGVEAITRRRRGAGFEPGGLRIIGPDLMPYIVSRAVR